MRVWVIWRRVYGIIPRLKTVAGISLYAPRHLAATRIANNPVTGTELWLVHDHERREARLHHLLARERQIANRLPAHGLSDGQLGIPAVRDEGLDFFRAIVQTTNYILPRKKAAAFLATSPSKHDRLIAAAGFLQSRAKEDAKPVLAALSAGDTSSRSHNVSTLSNASPSASSASLLVINTSCS